MLSRAAFGSAYDILPFTGDVQIQPSVTVTSDSPEQTAAAPDRIRVAFYNIEMFTDGIKDGDNRKETDAARQAEGAAAIIGKLDADILLISEIENSRILSILNESLASPYPFAFVSDFGTGSSRNEKMNIALLSRIQPESVDELDFGLLTGAGRPTRGLLRCIVRIDDNRRLAVYSAHMKSNWGKKQKNYSQRVNTMSIMLNDIAHLIAERPGMEWEIMLVGDFNTDPLLDNLKDDPTLLVLPGWRDLWAEQPGIEGIFTVSTRFGDERREFPPALFDRFLIHPTLSEKPWAVGTPRVLPEGTSQDILMRPGEGGHVSDHFPVFLDITR